MHCPHLDYAKPASLLGSSCTNQFNQSSISFADWIPRRQNGWCRLQQLAQLQRRFWLHVTRVRAQPPPGSTCQHGGDLVLHVASACMCMHACTRPRPYVQMQSTSTTNAHMYMQHVYGWIVESVEQTLVAVWAHTACSILNNDACDIRVRRSDTMQAKQQASPSRPHPPVSTRSSNRSAHAFCFLNASACHARHHSHRCTVC